MPLNLSNDLNDIQKNDLKEFVNNHKLLLAALFGLRICLCINLGIRKGIRRVAEKKIEIKLKRCIKFLCEGLRKVHSYLFAIHVLQTLTSKGLRTQNPTRKMRNQKSHIQLLLLDSSSIFFIIKESTQDERRIVGAERRTKNFFHSSFLRNLMFDILLWE